MLRVRVACRVIYLVVGLCGFAAGDCVAQTGTAGRPKGGDEIANFRLTGGVEGSVVMRYLGDDNRSVGPAEGVKSHTNQSTLTEEVTLMTRGYIYHPNLLEFVVGGGPVFDRAALDADGVVTNSSRQMYNLNLRATVLREKPYTGALFYSHENDTQSVGPAQTMQIENTRYGLNFSLKEPVTRFPLQMEFERSANSGNGAEQNIDDRIDKLHVAVDADLDKLGWTSFQGLAFKGTSALQYDGSSQHSSSGSTGLPIQAGNARDSRMNLDTRLKFGAGNEYDLANTITLHNSSFASNQGPPTELADLNFALDLRARHSEELQSNARYSLNASRQGDQSTTVNAASAGLTLQWTPELGGNLGARAEHIASTQVNSTSYGVDGSMQYRQALPLGQATVGYNVAYNQRRQQAGALQTQVFGEHVTLNGTGFATLAHDQIDSGSLLVGNLTHSQVFVEGLDYLVTPLGLKLRIQRLVGGNILDGQELLVDYTYATGGNYALGQLDNSVSLGWSYQSYLSLMARRSESTPRLLEGSSTAPLNPGQSRFYSAHVEFPVPLPWDEFILGGNAEREYRQEVILPFRREGFDLYTQMNLPLFRSGSLQLSKRQLRIDYEDPLAQDVDTVSYDLRLSARLGLGIVLNVESTRERDTGTALARERSMSTLKAKWRKAKLQSSLELSRVHESQGIAEKTRTVGQFTLRREL